VETRAVIFDLDGTLADSEDLAFRAAEIGLAEFYSRRRLPCRIPERAELRALVGLPSLEYFGRLVPPEHRGDAEELRSLIARYEVESLARSEGRLFPGVPETLSALRDAGWRLAIVSNCGNGYFSANLDYLRLRDRVDLAYCLDDLPSKRENVARALSELNVESGVMVGDRAGDIEAGRANRLRTVGCTYGFGTRDELSVADRLIDRITELPAIVAAWS
jgi:phosphoglycolate phosphatase